MYDGVLVITVLIIMKQIIVSALLCLLLSLEINFVLLLLDSYNPTLSPAYNQKYNWLIKTP